MQLSAWRQSFISHNFIKNYILAFEKLSNSISCNVPLFSNNVINHVIKFFIYYTSNFGDVFELLINYEKRILHFREKLREFYAYDFSITVDTAYI